MTLDVPNHSATDSAALQTAIDSAAIEAAIESSAVEAAIESGSESAVDSAMVEAATADAIVRPGPFAWVWYAIGGRIPQRHRSWVLYDVTCRTWLLRHFARITLIIGPLVALYLALMPIDLDIRLLTGLTFGGGLFMFGLVNTLIDTDRRAVRAGYGVGLPAQLRSTNSVERQRLASRQRRERIAERQAARRR